MRTKMFLAGMLTVSALLSGCGLTVNVPGAALPVADRVAETGEAVTSREGKELTAGSVAYATQALGGLPSLTARKTWSSVSYGSDALHKLDIYGTTLSTARRPVVVYVHGGGWYLGDKASKMQAKPVSFNDQGYVFISINYRLADPSLPVGKRPMHPCQVQDVARAIAWVRANISRYGGDPAKLGLMGHSAGGHLVSLVASNPRFLAAHGLTLGAIRGVVANDTASYDLTTPDTPAVASMITNAFGTDRGTLVDASPLFQLKSGQSTPTFLVLVQGSTQRVVAAKTFWDAAARTDARVPGDAYREVQLPGYDHEGMNDAVGRPGEQVLTPMIQAYYRQAFGI
jgi:acetyl esterase/lipase